ncbi:hypothetical protein BgiMline_018533 [Biomphalaria glabrata]
METTLKKKLQVELGQEKPHQLVKRTHPSTAPKLFIPSFLDALATETPNRKSTEVTDLGEDGPPAGRFMTHVSENQSHLEADRPKTIISNRTTTTIGTWNVRTMYETGKTAQVAAEMKRYNLYILGTSESTWTGSGQKRLTAGELLLYSGHKQEATHTQGVGKHKDHG